MSARTNLYHRGSTCRGGDARRRDTSRSPRPGSPRRTPPEEVALSTLRRRRYTAVHRDPPDSGRLRFPPPCDLEEKFSANADTNYSPRSTRRPDRGGALGRLPTYGRGSVGVFCGRGSACLHRLRGHARMECGERCRTAAPPFPRGSIGCPARESAPLRGSVHPRDYSPTKNSEGLSMQRQGIQVRRAGDRSSRIDLSSQDEGHQEPRGLPVLFSLTDDVSPLENRDESGAPRGGGQTRSASYR